MADMDKDLVLKITSDSNEATKAIDSLIESLKNLDTKLKLGNLEKFSTSLKNISDAISSLDKIGGIGNGINSFVEATSKLREVKISKNNAISKIVPDLKELQGITVPNFGNLDVLADILIKLQTVNPRKITAIATAIKDFGGNFTVNISGLDKAASVAGAVANSASGIKETTSAINGLAEAEQNASMSASQMVESQGIQQAKENVEQLSTDIRKCGESAKGVTADLQKVGKALDPEQIKEGSEAFDETVDSAERAASSTSALSEKYASLLTQIKEYSTAISAMKKDPQTFDYDKFTEMAEQLAVAKNEFKEFESSFSKVNNLKSGGSALAQEMQRISEKIKEVKSQMYELNDIQGSDGSVEYKSLEVRLQMLTDRYNALNEIGKKNQSVVADQKSRNIDLLASLVALGHELQTVASTFDKWGDAGIRLVKMVFSPLRHEFEEFKAKISGISNAMKNLRNAMQKHLDKMSAFWKRAMKTFTFMLVRKAITAILNETKNAIDSLAAWSNTFGTQFNTSMSEIVADATYLARSLIAIFEPIINAIVPILNTLVNALGRAARALAEFFAAFTGQNYFMVAKKQVGNYTDSLNKANKAQKNLTMGIDELNILSENNSGGGSGGALGGLGDWDTAPVSDKMRKFADDIKEILDKLFDPIKKAWDKAKTYVTNSFKYMTDELGKLAKKMGQDFLEVWNQPKTVQMLTELFMILGDIETTIGNLAKRFREAWTEGDKGKKIFEGIRDILAILIGHVRNVTFYMTKWSNSLNFNPLLEKTVELLQKMKPLAEFIGGLFQDIMKNVVLEYIKFLIEDGIPHLLKTIGEILDAFDFSKLREQFAPIEKAFEKVLENVDKGVVNAIGNFGKAVGEFTQSEDFQKFLDTIVWFLNQITEARVQKVFDVLGGAILKVSKALINFVSSDDFKDFLEMILKWFDDTDTDKLSDGLINIAKAILAFKFTGFIGKGVAGFASFLSVLASAKNAIGILTGLGSAGTAAGAGGATAAGGFGAFAAAIAPVAAVIAGIVTAVYSLIKSFGGVKGVVEEVSRHFKLVTDVLKRVAEALKLNDFIDRLKKSFDDLKESLGAQKGLWQAIMYVLDGVAIVVGTVLIPVFEVICHVLSSLIEICAGVIEGIGGVFNVLMGFINGDGQQISEGWSQIFGGMEKTVDGFLDFFLGDDTPLRKLVDFIANEIFGKIKVEAEKKWKEIKEKILIPIKEAYDKASERFSKLKEDAGKKWDEIKKNAEATWLLIKNNIIDPVKEAYNNAVENFNKLKEDAGKKWDEIKKKAEETWLLIKEKIINPIVEAYNKVMEKVKLLKEEIGKKWDEIKKKAEDTWLLIKSHIIDPVVEAYNKTVEKFRQLRDDAGKAWDEFVKKIKESAIVQFFSNLVDKVKEVIDSFKKFNGDAKDSWNEFCSAIENSAIVTFISGLVDKVVELINKFKDLKGAADDAKGSTDEVKAPQAENHFNGGFVGTYATGGYPSRGTLFWAGEYGLPEMLGTVGGKTAVASSAEITGIRESVMESSIAEQNMMGQMINLLQAIALKDTSVNLDSRELVSSLNDRARRNGYNFRAATT